MSTKSIFKSGYSTSTIIGLLNEFEGFTVVKEKILMDCTINAKRKIVSSVAPTKVPQLFYFGIGLNGFFHKQSDKDGIPISQPYIPKATNMDLYSCLPLRCVPIDADLDPDERKKYRIRTKENYNGEDYWCYWLKKIDYKDNEVKVMRIDGKTKKEEPYVFDPKNLWPVPAPAHTGKITDINGDTVVIYLKGTCEILGKEILEAINVIHKGDLRKANISEFGFYTGEDKIIKGDDGHGGEIEYTESIYTQLAAHRCTLGTPMGEPDSVHRELITWINSNVIYV